jgi:branched-chain amino acid transport system substrate-binding protein
MIPHRRARTALDSKPAWFPHRIDGFRKGWHVGRYVGGLKTVLLAATILAAAAPARAQITIGAILSITGPTAAQGEGYKNAFELFPQTIAGQKVTWLIRDDGNDPAAAVTIAKKLMTEDHVDALIGPASVAPDLAVIPIANEAKVPLIAMSPIVIDAQKTPYAFDVAQPAALMVQAVVDHMKAHGVHTVGFIGYSDGWGDQVFGALKQDTAAAGMTITGDERYARTDTSVQPQVLRAISRHPDAVMLGGSATPGALPNIGLTDRGFKGQVYNNHGVVSPEYIRVGGVSVEGCIAPTGPLVVYDQLPGSNPVKPVATAFMQRYLEKFGPKSRNAFAGYSYDAMLLIQAAIPGALAKGKPGTEAFRVALRDGIEQVHELVGTHGVYTMTPTDHNGMDARARVLVQVKDGAWKLIQ